MPPEYPPLDPRERLERVHETLAQHLSLIEHHWKGILRTPEPSEETGAEASQLRTQYSDILEELCRADLRHAEFRDSNGFLSSTPLSLEEKTTRVLGVVQQATRDRAEAENRALHYEPVRQRLGKLVSQKVLGHSREPVATISKEHDQSYWEAVRRDFRENRYIETEDGLIRYARDYTLEQLQNEYSEIFTEHERRFSGKEKTI
jgi:hypothetical protein